MSLQELGPEPPLFSCILFGPTCDAFDKLFLEELQLPELNVGDGLGFPTMGAYTNVMTSTFNGFPPASICCTVGPELRCAEEERGWAVGGSHQDLNLARGADG